MTGTTTATTLAGPIGALAAETERRSQEVTQWGERAAWLVGIALLIALVYWLMREGWTWRAGVQSTELPEPEAPPADAPGEPRLTLTGRYHGTTHAGRWLDRVVAHGLGARSRAELTLTDRGLTVVRPGARDFWIPADALRGARAERAIAGKVLPEGGLLVITWDLGGHPLDSGFRSDRAAEHAAWIEALGAHDPAATTRQPLEEGAR